MQKGCILKIISGIVIILFIIISCSTRTGPEENNHNNTTEIPDVDKVGSAATLEIATWNLEYFPQLSDETINAVKDLIRDLDIDIFAVQEIASISGFEQLLDSLPDYNGQLSSDQYSDGSYQKTGFIYKTALFSVSNLQMLDIQASNVYGTAFPRLPFSGYFSVKKGSQTVFDFQLVVLHLKAYGDQENIERRKLAAQQIETYISSQIQGGADTDFIVLGDWNDSATDAPESNIFQPFFDKPLSYNLLTANLPGQYSYILYSQSMIDHILVTDSVDDAYGDGQTKVLYLDNTYTKYPTVVSDHRPVVAIFDGLKLN